MKAVIFDEELKLVEDYKKPELKKAEVLIKPEFSAICIPD